MPHLLIEYSNNVIESINSNNLMQKLHDKLEETKLFDLNDIKSRTIVYSDYLIGDGLEKRGFATITLSILNGRNDETKKMLSNLCLDVLKEEFSDSFSKLFFSITVQIKEIDKNSYGRITSY